MVRAPRTVTVKAPTVRTVTSKTGKSRGAKPTIARLTFIAGPGIPKIRKRRSQIVGPGIPRVRKLRGHRKSVGPGLPKVRKLFRIGRSPRPMRAHH